MKPRTHTHTQDLKETAEHRWLVLDRGLRFSRFSDFRLVSEALTGFRRVLEHLDGRRLVVKSGESLQPAADGVAMKAAGGVI